MFSWNVINTIKKSTFFRSLFAFLFGDVFGSLVPLIFGSLRASFFSFFWPKGTNNLTATHFYVDLLSKCASEPRNPPKMVAQRPPKGAKKVPKRPSEPQKNSNIDLQSLQARLQHYQPTIQPQKCKTASTNIEKKTHSASLRWRWAGGITRSV